MLTRRIETPRLTIRCWSAEDAAVVKLAEDESREHLARFMPWAANGPETLAEVVAKLTLFRAKLEAGEDFLFGAFEREGGALVGGCGLHPRAGAGGIEVGYWVRVGWLRKGIATEMAAALTRVAFEDGRRRFVEIRCSVENVVSAKVPAKLGFVHEATLRGRLPRPGGGFDDAKVFSLFEDGYTASAARGVDVSGFDTSGRRVM